MDQTQLKFNSQPCAVCGETDPNNFRIWFDDFLKLYRCLKCGFVSQFPGPGRSTIRLNYDDVNSNDFIADDQEFLDPDRSGIFNDTLNRIIEIKKKGRILDVGCLDGHFLSFCSKAGFECHGVEASQYFSSHATKKTSAKIVHGYYDESFYPEAFFEVITLIQVLEHIPTPLEFLKIVYKHLLPGGLIVVEIPSIQAPPFLAYKYTHIKAFVKRHGKHGIGDHHFGYYSPSTLTTLMQTAGFQFHKIITGRWKYKYSGTLRIIGTAIDPLLNSLRIGGILYLGFKPKE